MLDLAAASSYPLLYLILFASLLLTAGALLMILDRLTRLDVSSIWPTYRGWAVILPLAVATITAGRVAIIVGVACLAAGACHEFARATGLERCRWTSGAVYLGIAAVAVLSLVEDPRTGQAGWYGLFMALPVYTVALLLILPVLRNRSRGQLRTTALAIVAFIYLGWMFGHLGFLANSRHAVPYLLYLVLAVMSTMSPPTASASSSAGDRCVPRSARTRLSRERREHSPYP